MSEPAFQEWLRKEWVNGGEAPRYILRLHPDRDCREVVRELLEAEGVPEGTGGLYALSSINAISIPLLRRDVSASFPDVAALEPDEKPAAVHGYVPRLPFFQSGLGTPQMKRTPFIPWGVKRIQAPLTWRRTTGDSVRVAVIDTGVDYTHPDLQGSIGGGINLIEGHRPPDDDNGHGTHISGTIAAYSKQGMTGAAPYATIFAVKAFDHNGSSYVTDIVRGIEWCMKNRIHIINMSFGMKTRSSALEAAVKAAASQGLLIVASAGNEGKKGAVDYPARFPDTIAVGATTRTNRIAPFCNYGPEIDIYAPGDKVISTWLSGRYHALSGTSMATSHVSGTLALLLSLKPKLKPQAAIRLLQKHATPIKTTKRKAGFLGEVNAARSVRAISRRAGAGKKR